VLPASRPEFYQGVFAATAKLFCVNLSHPMWMDSPVTARAPPKPLKSNRGRLWVDFTQNWLELLIFKVNQGTSMFHLNTKSLYREDSFVSRCYVLIDQKIPIQKTLSIRWPWGRHILMVVPDWYESMTTFRTYFLLNGFCFVLFFWHFSFIFWCCVLG